MADLEGSVSLLLASQYERKANQLNAGESAGRLPNNAEAM
jgi:hypothetical protein